MKPISELNYTLPAKTKKHERGELLKLFSEKLEMPIPRVAYHLAGFKVKDMYYIKSFCEQEEERGEPFSKTFWSMLKVK